MDILKKVVNVVGLVQEGDEPKGYILSEGLGLVLTSLDALTNLCNDNDYLVIYDGNLCTAADIRVFEDRVLIGEKFLNTEETKEVLKVLAQKPNDGVVTLIIQSVKQQKPDNLLDCLDVEAITINLAKNEVKDYMLSAKHVPIGFSRLGTKENCTWGLYLYNLLNSSACNNKPLTTAAFITDYLHLLQPNVYSSPYTAELGYWLTTATLPFEFRVRDMPNENLRDVFFESQKCLGYADVVKEKQEGFEKIRERILAISR